MWVWTICQPSWLSTNVLLYLMPSLVFCRPFPFDVLGGLLTLNVSSSRSLPFLLPIPSAASLPQFHAPLKIGNDTVSHLNYIAFHNSLGVSLVKQETYWLSLQLHSCHILKTPMGVILTNPRQSADIPNLYRQTLVEEQKYQINWFIWFLA